MVNNDQFIKVHVTREQRELLELLVNRRINDVQGQKWGMVRPADGELEMLQAVKKELFQAGS
jgi:hypothetical protein